MGMGLSDFRTLHHSKELHLCPSPSQPRTSAHRRASLSHTWLMNFAAPTEHDLCDLREDFDPRARWRNAIGAARAMSCFAKGNGANDNNNNKRTSWYSALTMKTISRAKWVTIVENPTPKDNGNTSLLHRQMIARCGAGWQDLWQRGLQR